MAGVVEDMNSSFLVIGVSTIVVIFSIFIYYKFFRSGGKTEIPSKNAQKKGKKAEKKPATPAQKSPAKSQKNATPTKSNKAKDVEQSKEQVLATTDEEDWVKVKPTKIPQTETAKPSKSPKQESQPKKNQQQGKKAEKTPKKNEKSERNSDNSPVIPPSPVQQPAEEEWQEVPAKKKKPRARKE